MRRAFIVVAALLTSTSFAQGVLERLEGSVNIIGRATNSAGAVFIELDDNPPNLLEAMQEGMLEEERDKLVIITPALVTYAVVYDGVVYVETTAWDALVFAKHPFFGVENIQIEGDGGRLLSMDSIEEARARTSRRSTSAAAPAGDGRPPPYNGCVSQTYSTGSTMTCYSNGQVSYRSVCTVDSKTNAVSCRSSY